MLKFMMKVGVGLFVSKSFFQSMHITEHELESVLQLDRNHICNVGTLHQIDIREHLGVASLHQRVDRTSKAQVPRWNGWEGTHIISHSGQQNLMDGYFFLKVEPHYNAYEKDIAVVNIFFGKPTVFGKNQLNYTSLTFN